jgi:dihydropyrimidinase
MPAHSVCYAADTAPSDPNKRETIRHAIMRHGADYTPYQGMAIIGWPVMTVLRSAVVVEDGRLFGAKRAGRSLERDLSPYAQPKVG